MTTKLEEIDLIIKRNTMGGSGKFDAKSAIPQLAALISSEIAKAKKRELEKIKEVASDNNWDAVILAGYIDGGLRVLADTESNKEGMEDA